MSKYYQYLNFAFINSSSLEQIENRIPDKFLAFIHSIKYSIILFFIFCISCSFKCFSYALWFFF